MVQLSHSVRIRQFELIWAIGANINLRIGLVAKKTCVQGLRLCDTETSRIYKIVNVAV